MPDYLLDTNILIAAKELLPMDIFPSFWQKLYDLANSGYIHSITKVKEEVDRGNNSDPLVSWCNTLPSSFFISFDSSIIPSYRTVISWSQGCSIYTPAALAEFSRVDIADAFLVATALKLGCLIVTNEVSAPQCKSRVKIPDVARGVGVGCISFNDMLRRLHVSL